MTGPTVTALTAADLTSLPAAVAVPGFDRGAATAGVVHLGVGGFHRSHQAVHLQRVLQAGDLRWGVHGVGVLRSDAALHEALTAQDGLYTLSLRDNDGSTRDEVIGSLLRHTQAPDDPEAVCAALASPATAVVTLTITEGGYGIDKANGRFVGDAALRADAARVAAGGGDGAPSTAFGFLLEGLRRRRAAGLPSFTVVSCDNLQHNGDLAARALVGFARLADPVTADWIEAHTAFPNSMVDRITPATTPADRQDLRDRTGLDDRCPVVAEPYLQWVLEDRFSADRPPLEAAGVQLVDDVGPYELMKLRLLNASHQVMSYLGVLAGHDTVPAVMADPDFVALLRRWMETEARPTLPAVPGVDLDAYRESLLHRFANRAVGDTLARNCAQGSERIATFVLPVVREALAAGRAVPVGALATAAWARYARGVGPGGRAVEVVDDRLDELRPFLDRAATDPAAVLDATAVFGDLGQDPRFRTAFLAADAALDAGADVAVAALVATSAPLEAQPAGTA